MQPSSSFSTLLQAHQGILHKVSRLYADTPADREDLRQEIAYQLWKAYPKFRAESKVSTWVYRVALNTALGRFFGFMVSNVPFLLEAPRLWLTGTITVWTIIALAINYGIWHRHLRKLKETLMELER